MTTTIKDIAGTWMFFTSPMEMGGVTCVTRCQVRVRDDGTLVPGTRCIVMFSGGGGDTRRITSGQFFRDTGNDQRYADLSGFWAFDDGAGNEMAFQFDDAAQEHAWGREKRNKQASAMHVTSDFGMSNGVEPITGVFTTNRGGVGMFHAVWRSNNKQEVEP